MTKYYDVRCTGYKKYGEVLRLSQSLDNTGLISTTPTFLPDYEPPFISDVVVGHNQTTYFNDEPGSTKIDREMLFVEQIIGDD